VFSVYEIHITCTLQYSKEYLINLYGDRIYTELRDILPKNKKAPYDKMRPPKLEGKQLK
jgi:hypothetical protein